MTAKTRYLIPIVAAVTVMAALCMMSMAGPDGPNGDMMSQTEPSAAELSLGTDSSDGWSHSGTCGKNLTYRYSSEDYTLIISGSGDMDDYTCGSAPWYGYCMNVDCIVLPYGLTHIGSYAFAHFGYLESVTMPDTIATIGAYAFYDCCYLRSVTIPESVVAIGAYAFCDCSSLRSVTIPGSVGSIREGAFLGCDGLQEIDVDPTNKLFSSEDGILYDKKKTVLVCCPGGNTSEYVTIPGTVRSIKEGAFQGCYHLQEILVSETNDSFSSENGILYDKEKTVLICCPGGNMSESMTMPGSVTAIGAYAFYECHNLNSVTIPDSVVSIGSYAFFDCYRLNYVTIPDSVVSIGDHAFSYCSFLDTVTIPGSVESIGKEAFMNCNLLQKIEVSSSNRYYSSENGILYDKEKTVLICCPEDCTSESIVIPWSVTVIEDRAFNYCSDVRSVTIPGSVASIGAYAFYRCVHLGSVTIPGSVASIGPYAFCQCNHLKSVTVSGSVAAIDAYAFSDCYSLESVSGSVTAIGAYAFSDCRSLKSVTVLDSVTAIGAYAFSGCDGLESVTVPDSVQSIGEGAFVNCYYLQKIDVDPANGYYSSEDGILYDKEKTVLICCPGGYEQSSLTIPDSVTAIDDYAFYWCDGLESVTVPDSVQSIGDYAFYSCKSLRSATIPDSVTAIGEYAFYNCYNLNSLTIAGSVTAVGDYAFSNCTNLESVTVYGSVTAIGNNAFSYCAYLKSVTVYGSVTAIGNDAFYYCKSLVSVVIPDSVISIGEYAFCNCDSLVSVVIPDSVISIGEYAFGDCDSLVSVVIPNSVRSIGKETFMDCNNLRKIDVSPTNRYYSSEDGILYDKEKTVLICCPEGYGPASLTIPGSVTFIGEGAFYRCERLESVTIPESVTFIGEGAFYLCGLTSLTVPESVTFIGKNAFRGCNSLAAIYNFSDVEIVHSKHWQPNGTAVIWHKCGDGLRWTYSEDDLTLRITGKGAMFDWYGADEVPWKYHRCDIVRVELPDGLTGIGPFAFCGCTSLTSVTVPESVTYIGRNAFTDCRSLAEAINYSDVKMTGEHGLPNGTAVIWYKCGDGLRWTYSEDDLTLRITGQGTMYCWENGDEVPWKCYRCDIAKTELPFGLTGIGPFAFCGCTSLTSVTIPSSVAAIGGYAFRGCSSLTSVNIPYSVEEIGGGVFIDCDRLGEINVSSANSYYSSDNGILYDKEKTVLVCCPACNTSVFLAMPDSVMVICDYAFQKCISLTSVTVPDSVTYIGKQAFSQCRSLVFVSLPRSLELLSASAFTDSPVATLHNYSDLKIGQGRYGLPDTVHIVSDRCGDRLLWDLSENGGTLTLFGSGDIETFYLASHTPWYEHRGSISEIVLPEGLTGIGQYAFSGCTSLTSVVIPGSVTKIGAGAFSGCEALTSVVIPRSMKTLESAGGTAEIFDGCPVAAVYNFSDLDIGPGMYGLPEDVYVCNDGRSDLLMWKYTENDRTLTFYGSGAMEDYSLSGDRAPWYGLRGTVDNIVLPEGLTRIGNYAFYGFASLRSVTVPGTVSSIGSFAFSGCAGLTVLDIPDSVTAIGIRAFADCGMLSSLSVLGSAETIGGWAFSGCTGLTAVVIPGTVRSIGKDAFENCPIAAVYNYSGLNIAPGTYGLPSSAAVRNGCPSVIEVRFFDGTEDLGTYTETVGRKYVLPSDPVRDGYAFLGWFDSRDVKITADTMAAPDGDTVLHARWVPVISVVFMDGEDTVDTVCETVGAKYILPPDPVRDGYAFMGWYADAEGTGTKITEETCVAEGDAAVLYALWEKEASL